MPPKSKDQGWRYIVDLESLYEDFDISRADMARESRVSYQSLHAMDNSKRDYVVADTLAKILLSVGLDPTKPEDVARVLRMVQVDPDDED